MCVCVPFFRFEHKEEAKSLRSADIFFVSSFFLDLRYRWKTRFASELLDKTMSLKLSATLFEFLVRVFKHLIDPSRPSCSLDLLVSER